MIAIAVLLVVLSMKVVVGSVASRLALAGVARSLPGSRLPTWLDRDRRPGEEGWVSNV